MTFAVAHTLETGFTGSTSTAADAVIRAAVAVLALFADAVVIAIIKRQANVVDLVALLTFARITARLAVVFSITGLKSIAELPVVTLAVVWYVFA